MAMSIPESPAHSSGAALSQWALPDSEPDVDALALLVDVHAHPTDFKGFSVDQDGYRDAAGSLHLHSLCAMSSHLNDQDLVRQLAQEHPSKIIPAFGLHPWWSHHISFRLETDAPLDKHEHYASLYPDWFSASAGDLTEEASSLLASFPEPTLFSTYLATSLRPHLTQFPHAMLGEVGLDRSFRVPYPQTEPKTAHRDVDVDNKKHKHTREGHRISKKFTPLKTPVEHQVRLLREQMEVAFELGRNVSLHSVQAQGATVTLLEELPKTSKFWSSPGCASKICMHSYGGSEQTIERLARLSSSSSPPGRIYFSFSTTINARLDRLEDLIRAAPDDLLLIESDFNDIRKSETRIWEILSVVCQAKEWSKERAVDTLRRNWQRFSGT